MRWTSASRRCPSISECCATPVSCSRAPTRSVVSTGCVRTHCGRSTRGSSRIARCGRGASMRWSATSTRTKEVVVDVLGDLIQDGDRWQLRFERQLPHPPARVWRALTEPEELRHWFPDQVAVSEWKVGAKLQFSDARARIEPFDGEVLAFEPPRVLEFRWGTDVIRFELA